MTETPLTDELMDLLLSEDEGAALDFKRDPYPFEGAEPHQKAELLKDILAFANAFRRATAYILIGVEDVPGGRGIVHGVDRHPDDASLQQFVNAKTNRPVEFRYRAREVDGKQVGVIEIPVQTRPLYLDKAFGKLKAHAVYVRRGSSTEIASPDEVARMGVALPVAPTPDLSVVFGDPERDERYGLALGARYTRFDMPGAIPDYSEGIAVPGGSINLGLGNRSYYRDFAAYRQAVAGSLPVSLLVTNEGTVPLRGGRLVVAAPRPGIVLAEDLPAEPMSSGPSFSIPRLATEPSWDVTARGANWAATTDIGTVQPGAAVWTPELLVGGTVSGTHALRVALYAENLPSPLLLDATADLDVQRVAVSVEQLTSWANGGPMPTG